MIRERLPEGIPLYRLLAGKFKVDGFLEEQPELTRLLTMALIESAPEIVHINHLMGFSPQIIRVAQRLGAAVVVSLHDFFFACPRVHLQKPTGELCKGPAFGAECVSSCFAINGEGDRQYWGLRAIYFQRALQMADRVIAYSEHVGSYFQPMCKVQIKVIANGVPVNCTATEDAESEHSAKRTLTLAYCGTVAPHKGPHAIIAALRLANLERVNLRVIGHAPDEQYAARLREKAGAISSLRLQMYGKFSRSELPLLLRGVDCVIVPSQVPEAGPIVPREALACGVPVVASRLGALPELITEGENGFTFDPDRPEELAAILRRLVDEEHLLPRLRAGARKSPVITSTQHAKLVRNVYEDALVNFPNSLTQSFQAAELDFLYDALLERERNRAQLLKLDTKDIAAATHAAVQPGS
jgi:glycosyltransferase involved in cell wall biosynthesis